MGSVPARTEAQNGNTVEQRITTNTPNIISDRCSSKKRNKCISLQAARTLAKKAATFISNSLVQDDSRLLNAVISTIFSALRRAASST